MELDITTDWGKICAYVDKAMRAGIYVSLATVDKDGQPTVMPIGSLVLDENDPAGFYLEKFPKSVAVNAGHNPRICILAEDTKIRHIFKELRGKGYGWLGVKLYGTLGQRHPATEAEKARIRSRLPLSRLPGIDKVLFGGGGEIRDLAFSRAEAITFKLNDDGETYQVM